MKRNILVFGAIVGTILTANSIYHVNQVMDNPNLETNDILGYATMIIIFSISFFGIRNYRNKELNGFISLGKAFKVGALIVLLASTIYVVVGLMYYYLFVPDFVDKFIEVVINNLTRDGATAEEIAAKSEQMAQFKEMYKNPLFAILISYMEVLPLGLIVAFFNSLILKRKQTA